MACDLIAFGASGTACHVDANTLQSWQLLRCGLTRFHSAQQSVLANMPCARCKLGGLDAEKQHGGYNTLMLSAMHSAQTWRLVCEMAAWRAGWNIVFIVGVTACEMVV
mmetsp:Transcript_82340/g.266614  ORF Transcript_82340/g.266614 Transcript_82340/m.266614 type:complete len:108 (+) Transcript_82340:1153-1476(+)